MTQVTAEAKNLRISARKTRLVSQTLVGKNALLTLETLKFEPKKAGLMIAKVLKSAIANATNNSKLNEKKLIIKDVVVNEGQDLKRSRPRSRGMAHAILKKSSHIRVVLEEIT
jgi:large subunit ribosomal protein L22